MSRSQQSSAGSGTLSDSGFSFHLLPSVSTSRADYDKQLQSSRQSIEIIASEIQVGDMIVESTADALELLYPCRCGDYFSITSGELSGMGIVITGDGEVVKELQGSDSASASVVLGCGSCSLKIRLVIDGTS
jgi:diphthamide biosynthesis protein 4